LQLYDYSVSSEAAAGFANQSRDRLAALRNFERRFKR